MPRRRLLWTVALMFLLAAVYFYQDAEWNGNSRLDLTRAIVERGSLQIDAYQTEPDWATEDIALYNGHYYSDKAIGSSLLAVPFYFLLYHFAAALGLVLNSVLIKHILTAAVLGPALTISGLAMYCVAGKLGATPGKSLVASLAAGLGTMLWPYSAVFYGHTLAAMFLVLAFYLLLSIHDAPETGRRTRLFAAGAALGLAFITEYTAALIIPALMFYAAYVLRHTGRRQILESAITGALGALIPLLLMFVYNYRVFGSPVAFGYTYEASDTFQQGMSAGLLGIQRPHLGVLYHITLDPKFGLLWLSPILLLTPIGYLAAVKRRRFRAEALLSLSAVSVMLIMNAGYYLWWGGHTFGPRLIIPALPFFVVPLALLPTAVEWPAIVLAGISIGQMAIPLMGRVQPALDFKQRFNEFFVDGVRFDGFSILYQHGLPLVSRQLQSGSPSWSAPLGAGLPYWLTAPILLALEAGLLILHRRFAQGQRDTAPESSPMTSQSGPSKKLQ